MRRATTGLLALTVTAAVAAAPADAAPPRVQRISSFQDVPVQGATLTYRLRLSYVAPGTWHTRGKPTGLAHTFGPIGSCRFTLRVRARAVADAAGQDAATRAARLLPSAGRFLLDDGTRRNAAFRVVQAASTDVVTGLFVRPAPTVRHQPASGRVWLEVRFTGTPDPSRECHAGGPRSLGRQIGDALATAVVGGFDLT
jgi:hypothetical protein